jgi:FlaA1/EpsC-like NDP-sugar epimerase
MLTLSKPLTEAALRRGLAIYTIPVFLCLVFFRAYQTVWSRAQLSNYVRLVMAVVMGTGIAVAIVEFAQLPHSSLFMFSCLYMALAILGLVMTRVLRAVVRDFFYALDSGYLSDSSGSIRTVVYGAGLRYRAFRRELVRSVGRDTNRRVIVGLLDDDTLIRNQYIGGIRIFGTLEQAPKILPMLKADLVVIACQMTPERRAAAHRILSACNVPVVEWTFEEKEFERKDDGNVHA